MGLLGERWCEGPLPKAVGHGRTVAHHDGRLTGKGQ